jgi:hypothetical protein
LTPRFAKNEQIPRKIAGRVTDSASKLSAFTFITPLFGVVASYFFLHDALTAVFDAAALPGQSPRTGGPGRH